MRSAQQLAKLLGNSGAWRFNRTSFNRSAKEFSMIYQQLRLKFPRVSRPAVASPPPPPDTSKKLKKGVMDASSFNRLSMAIISAGALQLSGGAFAQMQSTTTQVTQTLTGRAQEAFARADTDKDGKLNKQEAAALPAVAEAFDKADTDKDGFLSQAEFGELVKEVGEAREVKQ
jgi:uncharacterized protein HemX